MREMSRAEAVVVRGLLAAQRGGEGERIRASGLPRSTYQEVRRRIYDSGWLKNRFVPNPTPLTISKLTFAIARPYSEKLAETSRAWGKLHSNVCLWTGHESIMGVFFGSPAADILEDNAAPDGKSNDGGCWTITVDPRAASVPAYFDFEGAWASFSGQTGTLTYPQPLLGGPLFKRANGERVLTAEERMRLAKLVMRPLGQDDEEHRVHPYFLPRSERRMLIEGWTEYRTFLDLTRIPSCEGRSLRAVAWIHGALLPDQRAAEVFRVLAGRCRVNPFLFVSDGMQVLFGALSLSPSPDTTIFRGRSPVSETLREYLTNIETVREPIETLSVGVDHRYDRLFPSVA
jgi:hypothetical protein